jgi:hypothetical protein
LRDHLRLILFLLLVSIEGLTNLDDLEGHLFDYHKYEQLSDVHPRQVLEDQGVLLRRNIQYCACALPSREEFASDSGAGPAHRVSD